MKAILGVDAGTDDGSPEGRKAPGSAWAMLFVLGFGLALVGLLDVGLLFVPPQWASLDWEFGTVSGAIDALPLVTIGAGLMAAAAVARGWRGLGHVVGIAQLLMAMVVLLLLVVFALDVPPALKAVNPGLRLTLVKAVAKTSAMGTVYVALYVALGVWTWRRVRIPSKGSAQ